MLRSNFSFLTLTFLLLAGACDSKGGETDSATGSTSTTGDSTAGDSTTDASTTDESPTSTATGGEDNQTNTTSTGEDTEGDTTGPLNPIDPAHESACEAACERTIACGGGDSDNGGDGDADAEGEVAECTLSCIEEAQELPPECVAAHLGVVQCIPSLSCLDLEDQLDEGPCGDELEVLMACDGSNCTQGNYQGEDECGVSLHCPDAPTQAILCGAETCVCTLDDVEVAQCPADNVCAEGDGIFDKMHACCNFE